jgi:hypothetical protein
MLLLAVPGFAQTLTEVKGGESFDVKIFQGNGCKTFALYKKGQTRIFQSLTIAGDNACSISGFKPQETATKMYKNQSDVEFGDFNFDGLTDLALLAERNDSAYGSGIYEVYLFSKVTNKFVPNPNFSELSQGGGMVEINKNNKMLYVHTDGPNVKEISGYKVVKNKPFKVYGLWEIKVIDFEITKNLVNGKWQTMVKGPGKSPVTGIYFDRGKTSKTISVELTENESVKYFKVGAAKGQIMTISTDSPDVRINIFDFITGIDDENHKIIPDKRNTVARLLETGDYYLEVSLNGSQTVTLTVKIQ